MDTNKHRRQFVNITATIIRTYHLVCQNIFTCLLNALTNLKTIHFKNLWSFFIMLICRDHRNQIFALFSHFALRIVSRWRRNVVNIPLLVKEFLRIYSLNNPFSKPGSFFIIVIVRTMYQGRPPVFPCSKLVPVSCDLSQSRRNFSRVVGSYLLKPFANSSENIAFWLGRKNYCVLLCVKGRPVTL